MTTYRGGQALVAFLERCRRMRRNATDAEALLWRILRNRQVAGAKFRRQHQFGPYILDFYCAEHSLAIEVDGSHHQENGQAEYDAERTAALQNASVKVLRFTNRQVLTETQAVAAAIWDAVMRGSSTTTAAP